MNFSDILIHAAISTAIVLLVALRPPLMVAALIVAAGWAAREAIQDHAKRGYWRWPGDWSTQKHLEWVGALLAGLIVAMVA